jgi:hypothetical protein
MINRGGAFRTIGHGKTGKTKNNGKKGSNMPETEILGGFFRKPEFDCPLHGFSQNCERSISQGAPVVAQPECRTSQYVEAHSSQNQNLTQSRLRPMSPFSFVGHGRKDAKVKSKPRMDADLRGFGFWASVTVLAHGSNFSLTVSWAL